MLSRALFNPQRAFSKLIQTRPLAQFAHRSFSAANMSVVDETPAGEVESIQSKNARLGVDTKFDQQKHAYVLTFPWNFPEIISTFEGQYANAKPMTKQMSEAQMHEFNVLFREFHQYCAMPDPKGIEKICEGRLASAVNQSVERIHFHGLDVEMANLTIEQPVIKILKEEIHHGLDVERNANGVAADWNVNESSFFSKKCTYYTPVNDMREIWDCLDTNRKPYLMAVTCLIESPMKMFVQNQNYSEILFGSNDGETVKNVVRFEANVKWTDTFKLLPVNNKPSLKWKITDFNNLMNENPYF